MNGNIDSELKLNQQELLTEIQSEPGISEILPKILATDNITLSDAQLSAFASYAALLRDWNTRINLTAITDSHGIAVRHFLDSLSLLPLIDNETARQGRESLKIIDVGTGAGFPGLPLRIVRPELKLTLLDSLQKRINFLEAVITELKLADVLTISSRAEDAAHDGHYREKFDLATARAVAPMPVLCEYLLPFVRPGGLMVAMKAQKTDEIDADAKAIRLLGGELETVKQFILSGTDLNRTLICVRKKGRSPSIFPRKAGTPGRKPLV